MTDALDTVDDGQAIKNLIQDLKEAGTQTDNTAEQLDEMGKTLSAGALMEAADQLSGLGDKITELGDKAKDAFLETQDATVKASTYFGETGKTAEETAGVIKDVYAEGVGDSMDSVSNAVITVKKNLKDLDETTLTHLTEQAITLDELYGIDMNETLRGVNSLMEQYGLTAQQAMDYIVKGTQNGLDKTNEMGDNLSEYSGKFAQAGYSAQEYFQLLQNGLDNGAYNLDKVNDAINEVTTRLVDGTIADSLSKIDEKTGEVQAGTGGWSKEVEDVFKQWQQGGATQKDVIDAIVTDIQNTENQQDKLNKAALAFGTMAEDGNAKFIESLTTVGDTYDDVAGSAENMFDQSTTDSQTFEASMRQLEQSLIPLGEALMNLANNIIPPIAAGLKQTGEFFRKTARAGTEFCDYTGGCDCRLYHFSPCHNSGYDDCGNARNSGPRTNHRNYCRCSCSNYRNHSHCEKLGRYIGVVRRFMGKSEREMLTSVGINLLIFYRNDTAGMGQPGGKIPKYPGMVGWNLEPDFGFFHKRMEYDHAESCSTRNYRNHNRPLADRS